MFSSLKCSSAVSFSAVYQCQILSISENLSTDMHGRLLYPTQIIRLDVRNPQTCQIEMSLYKDRATFHTIIFTISRLLLPNKTENLWELSQTAFLYNAHRLPTRDCSPFMVEPVFFAIIFSISRLLLSEYLNVSQFAVFQRDTAFILRLFIVQTPKHR
jgi:hypothetical protein